MPFPEYIATRTLSAGGAATIESNRQLKIRATLRATKSLIWSDTGFQFLQYQEVKTSELGSEVTFNPPRTDLAGWKDYETKALIDVSAPESFSHRYLLLIEYLDEAGSPIGIPPQNLGPFVLPAGDGVYDIDKSVVTGTVAGDQVSIPDLWSQLVADAQASAAEAVAALIDSDAFIADKINDPESQTGTALYGTIDAAVAPKANSADVYTKTAADTQLSSRPRFLSQPAFADVTWISLFQSGHGWTNGGGDAGATVNLNDTSGNQIAAQKITVLSGGGTSGNFIKKTGMPAINLSQKQLVLLVEVDNLANMQSCIVYLGTGNFSAFVTIPSFTGSALGSGYAYPTGKIFPITLTLANLTVGAGTLDLSAVTDIQIRTQGNANGPVKIGLLGIGHQPKPARYPNGAAPITLDDGYDSHKTIVLPDVAARGLKAHVFPIFQQLATAGCYAEADLLQFREMFGWGVGAHSYTLANHASGYRAPLTDAQIEEDIRLQREWLDARRIPAGTLAYPGGWAESRVESIAQKYGFQVARRTFWQPIATVPAARPMQLDSFTMDSSTSAATVTGWLAKVKAHQAIMPLTIHRVVESGATGQSILRSTLNTVLDYYAANGIAAPTLDEAYLP